MVGGLKNLFKRVLALIHNYYYNAIKRQDSYNMMQSYFRSSYSYEIMNCLHKSSNCTFLLCLLFAKRNEAKDINLMF